MSGDSPGNHGYFPTTHWSLVGRASLEGDQVRRAALNELLNRYWPALKAHLVVNRRIDPNLADDFVQGFIENKILERHLVETADPARGKFRNLLMTALDNYVANQFQGRKAAKRLPDRAISMEAAVGQGASPTVTPDQVFDVEWARQLLAETLRRMEAECSTSAREDLWGVFEVRIVKPIFEGAELPPYEEIVERFGYRSPSQSSNALITAKRMFVRNLKSVIGEYAVDQEQIDEELRELHSVLAKVS